MSTVTVKKPSAPEAGDYLEDGKRMVYVTGFNGVGSLMVEDATTGTPDTLTKAAALAGWRIVPRGKHG